MAETTNRCDEFFADQRPWGQFEQFVRNEAVTVKIITVDPGQRLSLQTHGHRDEMWQILDSPLEIQVGAAPGRRSPASAPGYRWGAGTGSRTLACSLGDCSRSRSGLR
jgi:mannose-6-phosphate isomerase